MIIYMDATIHDSRKQVLQAEFDKPYFSDIKNKLLEEKQQYTIFPPAKLIFNAFDTTPFDNVEVVILGQDPYHGPWQAMGLSFSVPDGVKLPPSLKNIYKEITDDVWCSMNVASGNLTWWAQQWVLLLNAFLTVRNGEPASHQKLWREVFTDAVIKIISEKKDHVVFLLWWNFARSKKSLIDTSKHVVLEAPHPSPFSVHTGFFGCKHFSQTNKQLTDWWKKVIDWQIV